MLWWKWWDRKPDPAIVRAKSVMFSILGHTVEGSVDEVADEVQDYVDELQLERSKNGELRIKVMQLEQDLQQVHFTIRRMRTVEGSKEVDV